MRAVPIFDGGGAAGGEIGRSRGREMDLLRGDWGEVVGGPGGVWGDCGAILEWKLGCWGGKF